MIENKTPTLGSPNFPTEECLKILDSDASSTADKKAAMASIGRKRDIRNKWALIHYSQNGNPEVVLQAVRGLLVFRKDPEISRRLKALCDHPNEMVRDVVRYELNGVNSADEGLHSASPKFMQNVVVQGDVLRTLEHVPNAAVHLTFTSPPYYNARDYSIYPSYDKYLDFLETVFAQVHRITKEGRFFILNTSPVIIPRAGRKYSSRRYPVPFDIHARLAKMGWEFIDDLIWAKPPETSKNRVAGFEKHRKPLTYKANPRTEYLMVYRKKSHKLLDWNVRQYDRETLAASLSDDDFERSNVWNIDPATDRVHSAVFPLRLCQQIIKLYSFAGDLAFDPFAGSGTLGKAAVQANRYCFLTEIKREYVERMQQKIGRFGTASDKVVRFMQIAEFASEVDRCQNAASRASVLVGAA